MDFVLIKGVRDMSSISTLPVRKLALRNCCSPEPVSITICSIQNPDLN